MTNEKESPVVAGQVDRRVIHDDKRCTWIENDDGVWETKCNELFEFNEGGPPENGFEFCPYCGKNLKPIRWQRLDV